MRIYLARSSGEVGLIVATSNAGPFAGGVWDIIGKVAIKLPIRMRLCTVLSSFVYSFVDSYYSAFDLTGRPVPVRNVQVLGRCNRCFAKTLFKRDRVTTVLKQRCNELSRMRHNDDLGPF